MQVNIPYQGLDWPLHLLIDSTGIKIKGEWNTRKHSGLKRRIWRKIHLGINEATLEIQAVKILEATTAKCATCSIMTVSALRI